MESLRRKMVGKLETSQKNLIHNKKMAFERIEAEIEDRIAELDEERRRCLSVIDEYDSGTFSNQLTGCSVASIQWSI